MWKKKKKEMNHIDVAIPGPVWGRHTRCAQMGPPPAAPHNIMCPDHGDTGADTEPGDWRLNPLQDRARRPGRQRGSRWACVHPGLVGAPPTTSPRQGAYSGSGSSNPALFAAICLRGVPTPRAPEKTTPRGDGKYISPPGGEENLFVFSLLITGWFVFS